jgi:hypothetical protein
MFEIPQKGFFQFPGREYGASPNKNAIRPALVYSAQRIFSSPKLGEIKIPARLAGIFTFQTGDMLREQSQLSRPPHRPTPSMDTQLAIDILDMRPHRIGRHHQQVSNLRR